MLRRVLRLPPECSALRRNFARRRCRRRPRCQRCLWRRRRVSTDCLTVERRRVAPHIETFKYRRVGGDGDNVTGWLAERPFCRKDNERGRDSSLMLLCSYLCCGVILRRLCRIGGVGCIDDCA